MTNPDYTPPSVSRIDNLKAEAQVQKAEVEALADSFDDSTSLSWFWALICGPLYFLVHGFWQRALVVLLLNFIFIGFIAAPFLAYPAWRRRAEIKAERMLLIDRVRRN
jgi:hypothetical protein